MAEAFRTAGETSTTAQTSLPKASDPQDVSRGVGELSPTLYRDTNKQPYLTKFLGMENIYQDMNSDTKVMLDTVDDYFMEKIAGNEFENTGEGYKTFMKKLEHLTNSQDMPKLAKLGVIANFIHYLNKRKQFTG